MYIVTLSVVCTLKGYNTKIKAMCKMMSKGLKEALTVSIVTYVTHVDRVESGVCRSKQCVNYVEGVERSPNSFNCYLCYSC